MIKWALYGAIWALTILIGAPQEAQAQDPLRYWAEEAFPHLGADSVYSVLKENLDPSKYSLEEIKWLSAIFQEFSEDHDNGLSSELFEALYNADESGISKLIGSMDEHSDEIFQILDQIDQKIQGSPELYARIENSISQVREILDTGPQPVPGAGYWLYEMSLLSVSMGVLTYSIWPVFSHFGQEQAFLGSMVSIMAGMVAVTAYAGQKSLRAARGAWRTFLKRKSTAADQVRRLDRIKAVVSKIRQRPEIREYLFWTRMKTSQAAQNLVQQGLHDLEAQLLKLQNEPRWLNRFLRSKKRERLERLISKTKTSLSTDEMNTYKNFMQRKVASMTPLQADRLWRFRNLAERIVVEWLQENEANTVEQLRREILNRHKSFSTYQVDRTHVGSSGHFIIQSLTSASVLLSLGFGVGLNPSGLDVLLPQGLLSLFRENLEWLKGVQGFTTVTSMVLGTFWAIQMFLNMKRDNAFARYPMSEEFARTLLEVLDSVAPPVRPSRNSTISTSDLATRLYYAFSDVDHWFNVVAKEPVQICRDVLQYATP